MSFVILQRSLLIGLCMACRPRSLQSAVRAGAVRNARLAGARDLPAAALPLATSLGRSLQNSPNAALAAFQAARGSSRITELYYGMP